MRTHLKRKEVDDVLGGKDSWANVDSVDGKWFYPFPALMITLSSARHRAERDQGGQEEGRVAIRTRADI